MTEALLVVHLQRDICERGTAFGDMFAPEIERRDVVKHVLERAESTRADGGLVVWLCINVTGDTVTNVPLLQAAVHTGSLGEGTPGAELIDAVRENLSADDVVFPHTRPGPFTASTLEELLRDKGVTDVTVAGVATNASVESTVRQASDLGFTVRLAEEACAAASPEAHEASVESMKALFLS